MAVRVETRVPARPADRAVPSCDYFHSESRVLMPVAPAGAAGTRAPVAAEPAESWSACTQRRAALRP